MRTLNEIPGAYTLLGTCALLGSASVEAQPVRPAVPRPSVLVQRPIGESAASPEARRFVEAFSFVEQQWRETEELLAQRQFEANVVFDEWHMAKALEDVAFAPPESSVPVTIMITGIQEGKPHSVSMEEFDYELIESLRGEL